MKKQRKSEKFRKTSETEIYCKLNIDGQGLNMINTPNPFITHMLEQISKHSYFDLEIKCSGDIDIDAHQKIGDVDAEVFQEFFRAFAHSAKMTIHIENRYGQNAHHIIESCFKALAICLRNSLTVIHRNKNIVPSTKGVI